MPSSRSSTGSRPARESGSVRVRFIKYDAPYEAGQEKECTVAEAEKLVRNGVAERIEEE